MCGADCFLMLLSVLFPPLGIWVKKGLCSGDSLINIALCCLGFLPGLIHSWYIILQNPDPYDAYNQVPDGEGSQGRTTYYVITHEQPAGRNGQVSYGTVANQSNGQQSGVTCQSQPAKANKASKNNALSQAQRAGEGSSSQHDAPPPPYADVIRGDNKVQDS